MTKLLEELYHHNQVFMERKIPVLCSAGDVKSAEEFLKEKGKTHLFSCIETNFEQPLRILEKLKDFDSRIVISGPSHELLLVNAGYHVIPIRSIGFNVINAIIEAKKYSNDVVFIWRGKPILNLDIYSEEMKLRVISTCCYNSSDIELQVQEFMLNGYNTFIGHRQVCQIVKRFGGRGICYHTTETFLHAIEEAVYQAEMFIQYVGIVSREQMANFRNSAQKKSRHYTFNDIVGQSPVMQYTVNMAKTFAETSLPVLIFGETGSGKELMAQSIHAHSDRRNKPFLAINCASISESLLESELFGYDKGSFTGANREGKMGVFELADSGTLFLDEIGEITTSMQTKLLRVLQEKQIRRVGGCRDIPVDIRILAATNQNLDQLIHTGQFRKDLYYRLNVLCLNMPPLKDRPEDIPELVYSITQKYHLEPDASYIISEILNNYKNYSWPGNVRELENIVQRLAVSKKSMSFAKMMEPPESGTGTEPYPSAINGYKVLSSEKHLAFQPVNEYRNFRRSREYEYLKQVLQYFNGNKTKTAAFLRMSRTTLWSKLKEPEAYLHGEIQKEEP